jgi:RimJ/RimL family protein N-acetyltransferase
MAAMQPAEIVLRTERLILRDWRDDDMVAFAALSADPEVGRFILGPLDRAKSDAFATRIRAGIAERGWGLWAVEIVGGHPFIGFTGLAPVTFEASFAPATEIAWRLKRSAWGHGYATEAANAVLTHAFGPLGFKSLVSITATVNTRSRRVMERIGMRYDPADDFDHPAIAPEHPLARHVLYRIDAADRRAPLVSGRARG